MSDTFKQDIIKDLQYASRGKYDYRDTFRDWLELVYLSLDRLPVHLQMVRESQPLTDTPETKAVFENTVEKYGKEGITRFTRAFAFLVESTSQDQGEWRDVLGDVFMEYCNPNPRTGQYFTPMPIATMSATMIMGDVENQIHERIKQAIQKSVPAQAALFAGLCITNPKEASDWYFQNVIPLAYPHIEPITVCDPACGSGVMLIAAAAQCPRWALDFNLVRFWGMDIDQTCVRMAQVNMMLYGLNGFTIKCAMTASVDDVRSAPQPWSDAYMKARDALEAGDQARVDEIAIEVGSWKQGALL